jgi:hypothetical protein
VTASTIGRKCRELRLPVHRMGRGFVAIIHSTAQPEVVQDRIKLLKVRYGLNDMKFEAPAASISAKHQKAQIPDPEEPETPPYQEELL